MLSHTVRTASAIALLAAAVGLVLAQPVQITDTRPAAGPRTALRAKSILGATVSLKGGTSAGTVTDFVVNDEGVVDYLIVSEGGKLVTVPWEAAKFNYEKRMATINITQDQFRQIPTYTTERYPDYYTPAYRGQVYKYYGLTPGRERRLERREERREERRP
jgi:PRC-barrel domain